MKHKILISLVNIAFITMFLITGCAKKAEPAHEEHEEHAASSVVTISPGIQKDLRFSIEPVVLKPYSGYITVPAKVITNQDDEALVGSLLPGRVFKVFVQAGDYVKAGQALMQIESIEIGVIKADFLKAKATLEYLKNNYERQKLLFEQKIGSQKSLLEVQAEYERAKAEYNAEDKKIHAVGLSDADIISSSPNNEDEHVSGLLTIKSPIGGIVVERNVVIGQKVQDELNAFRIINITKVLIEGQIREHDLPNIEKSAKVTFISNSGLKDDFTGVISYVGSVVDDRSRTIGLRAEINNVQGKLKPNMFGEMKIAMRQNSQALLISSAAVQRIQDVNVVFVQKDDSSFEKREVKLQAAGADFYVIQEGLQVNEKIVINGAFYLKSELLKSELEDEGH